MKRCLIGLIFFATFISMMHSCALYQPIQRDPEKSLLPSSFSIPPNKWDPARRWWEAFDDPQLNTLVEEALGNNFSLQQSWARLQQSQALAVRSDATLYPDLTLGAGASSQRSQTTTTETVERYSLGLSSSYEIDLWGRIRSGRQAALLSAMASREDLKYGYVRRGWHLIPFVENM